MTLITFLLACCSQDATRHTFNFPHIPFGTGLRHIHTPEICVEPYALMPIGFRILRTQPPERVGDHYTARFTYTTILGHTRRAVIFTACRQSSNILFLDDALLATLSVRPYKAGGLSLTVTSARMADTLSQLERILAARIIGATDVHCAVLESGKIDTGEDRNLMHYRREALAMI